jgi:hypothetical protein
MSPMLTFQPDTTLAQAIDFAQRLESDKARLQQFQPAQVNASFGATIQPNLEQLIATAVQKALAEDKAKRQAQWQARQANNQNRPPIICHKCQEPGHIARNCTKNQPIQNNQSLVATTLVTNEITRNIWEPEEEPDAAAYPAERKNRKAHQNNPYARNDGQPDQAEDDEMNDQQPENVGPIPQKQKKKVIKLDPPHIVQQAQEYSIVNDLLSTKANITFAQLMANPTIRKELKKGLTPKRRPGAKVHLAESKVPDNATFTPLTCQAQVYGWTIRLIVDSGSSISVISKQFLADIGHKVAGTSNKTVSDIHGEKKRPVGFAKDIEVAVGSVKATVDMDVIDAKDYAIIVGTDWLTKVHANINFNPAQLTISQNGTTVTVPCQQWREKEKISKTLPADDTDSESESEDEEAATYVTFLSKEEKNPSVVFNKKGIKIRGYQHDWFMYNRLVVQMNRKHKKSPYIEYAPWGPNAECWCGYKLYSPEDECSSCVLAYRTWQQLSVIPKREISKAQILAQKADNTWQRAFTPDKEPPKSYLFPTSSEYEEPEEPPKSSTSTWDNWNEPEPVTTTWLDWAEEVDRQIEPASYWGEANITPVYAADIKPSPLLTLQQQQQLDQLIYTNDKLFNDDPAHLKGTHLVTHHIDTTGQNPVQHKLRSMVPRHRDFLKAEIDKLLKAGIIVPSHSPWGSAPVIVDKKNGKLRLCIDYRELNTRTKLDAYPLPNIPEMLESFGGCRYFSTIDLASGYWQVPMAKEDQEKTAFKCKFGLYEFTVMPFGLTNAPATFQRLMDKVLETVKSKFADVYMDDIIVYSQTFQEHLDHLQQVFNLLEKAGLMMGQEKCFFCRKEIEFLGHIITPDGLKPNHRLTDKIRNFPTPTDVTTVRSFLGLANYYQRFIPDYATKAYPLTKLLRKRQPFEWTEEQQNSLNELKQLLISEPIVQYPDFRQEFILATDASNFGLGAVLSQKSPTGIETVIAYASRTLNSAERNYGTTEKECLAIVWACRHFNKFLIGRHFTLITDHAALRHLNNSLNTAARHSRWITWLAPYDYIVQYRKGSEHGNADALSRLYPPRNQQK